jgi:hypothetical protein
MANYKTPPNMVDMAGKVINGIKVIERAGSTKNHNALWLCECKCGQKFNAIGTLLRRGEIVSCGCERPAQAESARGILMAEKTIDGVVVPLLTKKVRSDSKTGHKGVCRRVRKGKVYFEAHITVKGKRIWGPPRTSIADAIADRKKLEEQYHKPYIEQLEGGAE